MKDPFKHHKENLPVQAFYNLFWINRVLSSEKTALPPYKKISFKSRQAVDRLLRQGSAMLCSPATSGFIAGVSPINKTLCEFFTYGSPATIAVKDFAETSGDYVEGAYDRLALSAGFAVDTYTDDRRFVLYWLGYMLVIVGILEKSILRNPDNAGWELLREDLCNPVVRLCASRSILELGLVTDSLFTEAQSAYSGDAWAELYRNPPLAEAASLWYYGFSECFLDKDYHLQVLQEKFDAAREVATRFVETAPATGREHSEPVSARKPKYAGLSYREEPSITVKKAKITTPMPKRK